MVSRMSKNISVLVAASLLREFNTAVAQPTGNLFHASEPSNRDPSHASYRDLEGKRRKGKVSWKVSKK